MDFSAVRLAEFNQARFRDVLAGDELPDHSVANKSFESPLLEPAAGRVIARAPEYTATSLSPMNFTNVRDFDFDARTNYCLVVQADRLTLWKQPSEVPVFFPLAENHSLTARFLPSETSQPHIVLVDKVSGKITYFDLVSHAIINENDAHHGRIDLSHGEVIERIEIVSDLGFVAATEGHLYLVNLQNDLGKTEIRTTQMHSAGLLSKLRSLGAFSRDIVSVKVAAAASGNRFEVFAVTKYGNVSIWEIGMEGVHRLVAEMKMAPKLVAEMNLIYPDSGLTLAVHDVAVEDNLTHFLVSFAPDAHVSTHYFVVVSFNQDFDVVSARRLQSYKSDESGRAQIHVVNRMLVIVTADAVAMLESPSKFPIEEFTHGMPPVRWEECLYLKPEVTVLGSNVGPKCLIIGTDWDLIGLTPQSVDTSKSTTKARLEQAVFDSAKSNPFLLTKWSEFESNGDAHAPLELALEIANATTPLVPVDLPNLAEHLQVRRSRLLALFKLAPLKEVREVAQALEVAIVLQHKSPKNIDRSEYLHNVLAFPHYLEDMAASNAKDSAATVLEILQNCRQDGLDLPEWATKGPLKACLEALTAQAADSGNVKLLETVSDLLCSLYARQGEAGVVRELLFKLASLGAAPAAIEIATKHNFYSALAPLEVDQWLQTGDQIPVIEHLSLLPKEYMTTVFETCVASNHKKELLVLAQTHGADVEKYLVDNNLPEIAWALAPESSKSTELLRVAAQQANTLDHRRLMASLYKLSAVFTGAGSPYEAQLELLLVKAQESLVKQFAAAAKPAKSKSAMLRRGIPALQSVLTRETAVELLALAPAQVIPETNDNFVLGFEIVNADDSVRMNLLVQQLIITTKWDEDLSPWKLKKTLFAQTFRKTSPQVRRLLHNFRASLHEPVRDLVQDTDEVYAELCEIALKSQSVADKYVLDTLVSQLPE